MEKWKTTERSGEMLIVINQNIVFRPLKKKKKSVIVRISTCSTTIIELIYCKHSVCFRKVGKSCALFFLGIQIFVCFFQNAQTFSFPDLKIEAKQVCVLIEQENI